MNAQRWGGWAVLVLLLSAGRAAADEASATAVLQKLGAYIVRENDQPAA